MIKKLILIFSILVVIIFSIFSILYFKPEIEQKTLKTMTVEEFLYEENTNHWNELYLNKKGNVEYKNMVIVKDDDHKPINEKSAYSDTELILLFRAKGIRPEEWGCDLSDTAKNGRLGCYMLAPGKKSH